jgi:tetratricopeptide (TPR) repeat protein
VGATGVSTWEAVVAWEAQRQAEADRNQAETDRDWAKAAKTQAEAAERRAGREATIAREVNRFLQRDVLRQVEGAPGPDAGHTGNLTVREALDRAAARIAGRFQEEPLVAAAIHLTIGQAYHSIGAEHLAVPHLERAFALRETHLGFEHEDTFDTLRNLADIYSWVGKHTEATALCQRLLENRQARLGPHHPETLACMEVLAGAYTMAGEWDTVASLREQLLEKRRTISGPTDPDTIRAMLNLAYIYQLVGRLDVSIGLYEKVLEHYRSSPDPDGQAGCKFMLALACQRAGKLDKSESLLREVLEIARKSDATCNQRLGIANKLGWLARTLLLKQQYTDAEPLFREALKIFEREEPYNQRYFYWMSQLGAVLLGQHRYAEAEPLLLQGYEGMKQREAMLPANEKPRLVEAGEKLVRFYEATNQPEKAREWREKLKAKETKS